jgi:hypothetical protein
MDQLQKCTELVTKVTRSEHISLSFVGMHESSEVCTQIKHKRKINPLNARKKMVWLILSTARHISEAAVLRKMMFADHMGHVEKIHFQTLAQIVKYIAVNVHFNAQSQ